GSQVQVWNLLYATTHSAHRQISIFVGISPPLFTLPARRMKALALVSFLLAGTLVFGGEPSPLIKPAVTGNTGITLLPDLDLSKFSTAEFMELSSSVGEEKLHKKWTSPVVTLPPHPRADVRGLTHKEVKDYMLGVRNLFNEGKAVPMSD